MQLIPPAGFKIFVSIGIILATVLAARCAEPMLDLTHVVIVAPDGLNGPENKAVAMLGEEVAKRTQVRWTRTNQWPADATAIIVVGSAASLKKFAPHRTSNFPQEGPPEGYRIWTEPGAEPTIWVAGNDSRGVLFGIGHLLRSLRMERRSVALPAGFQIKTAPRMPLRGHQLGYRPKTNSYDGWTVAMWEQYIRDLIVFGCNAIELIPPRSDDDADSPHFPLPQMEMMVEMSRLSDEYGLDVWIWYPAMDKDYSDPQTIEFALKEWGEVFGRLPRVDAVFVPGGDPGHTQPKYLLALLEKQTANLRRHHPRAQMWVSPQSFTKPWMDEFLELLKAEPTWLTGVVFGPQVRMPLADLRALVPKRYPIRDYPDITHSRHCQYPVPGWDLAFAITEGRETINPRPTQMAQIFRVTTRPHAFGYLTYSEGCNDDVNKAVWSALGWNPDADVREVLRDYGRYFIGAKQVDEFADGMLALEKNWQGAVLTNKSIETTWLAFRAMEQSAAPQEKLNWRFQQGVYRACYDAYVSRRLQHETQLEEKAMGRLREAARDGSLAAIKEAEEMLDRAVTQPVAVDLRARLFELAEALFQSIRMQLSVERYAGMSGRGNNLDDLDQPLNNAQWLKRRFAEIRNLAGEEERLHALDEIVNWTDPGPGGFYDDPGNPARQPHLARGAGWENDPGFFATPQVGFTDRVFKGLPLPLAWWTSAESLYDSTLRMRYTGLDRSSRYRLRVVYGRYKNSAKVRLLADDTMEVHPWLQKEAERLEFDVPSAATADGELTLTWLPEPGRGENGRVLEVAEVWLLKK
jgi:hypothetical protein